MFHIHLETGLVGRVAAKAFGLDPARPTLPPLDGLDLRHLRAAMGAVDAERTAARAGGCPFAPGSLWSSYRLQAALRNDTLSPESRPGSHLGSSGQPWPTAWGEASPARSRICGFSGRKAIRRECSMKIDHVEVVNLRFDYPAERRFQYAGGTCTGRLTTLVLVHTDTGRVGVGSVYSHPGLVSLVIKGQLEPLLRGRDPREVEYLWERMYAVTRWYGRKGAALSALGGLDTAFWDLRGQALGRPVWALFGGQHPACPAYASALLWKPTAEALAEEAAGHLDRGFRRMKMRLGQSEEYDMAAVRAVRAAVGKDNDVMVDASMRYHVALARRVGRVLQEGRVFWFEEPFTPEDIDSYTALRGTVGVRLAAGENEFGVQGFRELIRARAVDIVQPDASRCGGLSEVVRVADMAREAGLSFAPHTWSDAVAVLANAQVVAARPNGLTVEIDQTGNPFIDDLLVEPLRVRDGQLALSNRPGLGVELNRAVLDRYRVDDPFTVPDGFYSDMAFGKDAFAPPPPFAEKS